MADNNIIIPELNPITFYDVERTQLDKYFTKHMEQWKFHERLYFWEERQNYIQIWQKEEIVYLQFSANFDPINVKLVDKYGRVVFEQIALIGMPNIYEPGHYCFEVAFNLGDIVAGDPSFVSDCYFFIIEAGPTGPTMKTYISDRQYISTTPIANSLLLTYSHPYYYKEVMFETGIEFQFRVMGSWGRLEKARNDVFYRDQKYNPTTIESRSSKRWPIYFGDQGGLPDDIFNLIDEILGCREVTIDNRLMTVADGAKFEFFQLEKLRKRAFKIDMEASLARNSRRFSLNVDTEKRLLMSAMVSRKVFGDLANQGSSNTVPTIRVE